MIDDNNSHLMKRNKNLFLSKLNTCVQNAERSANAPCFSLQPKIQIMLRKIRCIIRIFRDFTLNYTFDRNPEAIQVLNHQDIH